MRIASASILIAVLCLAAEVRAFEREGNVRHYRHAARRQDEFSPARMQKMLRLEGGAEGRPVDCCPAVMEVIEPRKGINQDGLLVDLYVGNNPNNETQRFFEYSCRPDVLNRPCRFVASKLRNQSHCAQKHGYQYAIVRHDAAHDAHRDAQGAPGAHHPNGLFPGGSAGWKLDYIRLRSGCSCEVVPKKNDRKKASGAGRGRYKGHDDSRELSSPSSMNLGLGARVNLDHLDHLDHLDDEDNT
ncbi:uncharacterized protein LOC117654056 isoform X2 [Thrips palmi]|uniref:Uncharacterized protein LOC117654056 isoform X2 n=1 Tax=Thrips palmi TaxID=161013 RepID=A0A6P9AKS0_THRPL|nr:uncharacterized protein LOC117654056 isoform X2 [Thrips palmi]